MLRTKGFGKSEKTTVDCGRDNEIVVDEIDDTSAPVGQNASTLTPRAT